MGGRNFFFLKIEENQGNQIAVSNEYFCKLRQENKSWLVILGTTVVFFDIMFSDMLISVSTRLVFSVIENSADGRFQSTD